MSPPWMPFYVADYLADTTHLSAAEHGAYMLLIMHYWQRGSLPDDNKLLARIVRMTDEQFSNARALLSEFFTDGWRHERIEAELAKAKEKNGRRVEAGRRGGMAKAKRSSSNAGSNALASSSQPQPDRSSLRSDLDPQSLRDCSSSPAGADIVALKKPKRVKSDDEDLIQDIAAIWNAGAASLGLPQISDIHPKRLSAVRARLRDFSTYGFGDAREGMQAVMAKIRGSPFLRGENDRGWRANFDYAMRPDGFTKIMEGAHEGQGKAKAYG